MGQALYAVIGSLGFILSAAGSYSGALRRGVKRSDGTRLQFQEKSVQLLCGK